MERDHGGNLDWAIEHFGGERQDWLDLSTGINRQPYPIPKISTKAWCSLPAAKAVSGLVSAARCAYRTQASVLGLAGAQAAIQLIPTLSKPGTAKVCPSPNDSGLWGVLISGGFSSSGLGF